MANFAKINNGIVEKVIVADPNFLTHTKIHLLAFGLKHLMKLELIMQEQDIHTMQLEMLLYLQDLFIAGH